MCQAHFEARRGRNSEKPGAASWLEFRVHCVFSDDVLVQVQLHASQTILTASSTDWLLEETLKWSGVGPEKTVRGGDTGHSAGHQTR